MTITVTKTRKGKPYEIYREMRCVHDCGRERKETFIRTAIGWVRDGYIKYGGGANFLVKYGPNEERYSRSDYLREYFRRDLEIDW
jgi:hypothetical protein